MNSDNLGPGQCGFWGSNPARITLWSAYGARPGNFGRVRPECPDFLKSTRDALNQCLRGCPECPECPD